MDPKTYDVEKADVAWCPGCGDFSILSIIKRALAELEINQKKLVMVSGIGQAAKLPHYLKSHVFNGLHGRSLPPAVAIKAVNPELIVIAESGDGDMYGEGGNHFIHTMRKNPDITNIVHNNMVYGLTKGQASPTSQKGFKTPVQVDGSFLEPFNPIAVAVAQDASFVARAFSGDAEQTVDIVKKAIIHKGYALVDIFQPCITFNRINTFKWFKDNTYYLEEGYDPANRVEAFKRAIEKEKLPLGIFYINKEKTTFEENSALYTSDKRPLYKREINHKKLEALLNSYK
ncbi:MAG: thiamine pyrophosphate-dependent enzyme [bacterium]